MKNHYQNSGYTGRTKTHLRARSGKSPKIETTGEKNHNEWEKPSAEMPYSKKKENLLSQDSKI